MILNIDKGYNHNAKALDLKTPKPPKRPKNNPYDNVVVYRPKRYYAFVIKDNSANYDKMISLFGETSSVTETAPVLRQGWLVGMVVGYYPWNVAELKKDYGKYIIGDYATLNEAYLAIDNHFTKITEQKERQLENAATKRPSVCQAAA